MWRWGASKRLPCIRSLQPESSVRKLGLCEGGGNAVKASILSSKEMEDPDGARARARASNSSRVSKGTPGSREGPVCPDPSWVCDFGRAT